VWVFNSQNVTPEVQRLNALARAAGIPVVCVPHGYNEGQDPRTLPYDAMVDCLGDLPDLLHVR